MHEFETVSWQGVGELDDEVWRQGPSINLAGPMFASLRAVQQMPKLGGCEGGAAGAAWTVSKHALLGPARNTAWMSARQGIRCNAICPGATANTIAETMLTDSTRPKSPP